MNLTTKIHDDLIGAMKAGDQARRDVLRLLENALKKKQIEIKNREDALSDEVVTELIASQIKQRKDSIEQYTQGGREDLASKEQAEVDMLMEYMPEQMSEEDLERIVQETITQVGARSPQDIGKVMGAIMGKVKGQADGNTVKALVEKQLTDN